MKDYKKENMLQKSNKQNRQVQRTKSWIFEALMLLMDEMPYNKITVSDISEKAGIARTTFYHNYDDKEDVLFEYLTNTINAESLNIEKNKKDDNNTIVLMFDHKYMITHKKNIKKILSIVEIENRIFREVQKLPMSLIRQYKEKFSAEEYLICRYKLCYQITGSLRVFFDWFINDMPLSVEKIVSMLNTTNIPKSIQYRNFPNIVVRLKE
jgi:AcrR family transcriptional regulator